MTVIRLRAAQFHNMQRMQVRRFAMSRLAIGIPALLAVSASFAAALPDDLPKPAVPSTSIERPENNPAKAAIAANEAMKKDSATAEETISSTGDQTEDPALLPPAQLAGRVEQALLKDTRTATLGVRVSVDAKGAITLRGTVTSAKSSVAAESVAAQAAGKAVQNLLVIRPK